MAIFKHKKALKEIIQWRKTRFFTTFKQQLQAV